MSPRLDKEIILINITGTDKPGVTTALTHILAEHDVNILDIGQAAIHDDLALGILCELSSKDDASSQVLKDLLFKAYEMDVNIKFEPIYSDDYQSWVAQEGKERNIITMVGRKLTALSVARITEVIANQGLNIDFISRLSGRIKLENGGSNACVQFSVRGTPVDKGKMRGEFMKIAQDIGVDIAFQQDNIFRRNRRLVCFDMDSTLIQTEVIDELAKRAGVGEQVMAITEEAMQGKLDFKESFKKRVALLKGLSESVLKEVAEELPITEGAEKLLGTLRKYGYKTAILSGGFTYFGKYLQSKFGVDYVFANELEIKDGKLTGNYIGEIVDGQRKADLLKNLAFKEDIHLEQVIAVGDGANDLPMLNRAGLGIAFHAKPIVKETAEHSISHMGLDGILYLMGFRDREVV